MLCFIAQKTPLKRLCVSFGQQQEHGQTVARVTSKKKKSLESSLERKTENRRIQYPGERRQLLAEIIFNLIMLRVI